MLSSSKLGLASFSSLLLSSHVRRRGAAMIGFLFLNPWLNAIYITKRRTIGTSTAGGGPPSCACHV